MNINPLANQKRRYRVLITVSILAAAIVVGWLLAQLLTSAFFPSDVSMERLPQQTEVEALSQVEKQLHLLPTLKQEEGEALNPELNKQLWCRYPLMLP